MGRNKGQIVRDFGKDDFLYFYGDMMAEGQNDFPLATLFVDIMLKSQEICSKKRTNFAPDFVSMSLKWVKSKNVRLIIIAIMCYL